MLNQRRHADVQRSSAGGHARDNQSGWGRGPRAQVDTRESGKSTHGGSGLPDFSKVSFRNEAYLDRIPRASVKLSSTGRTI